MGRPKHPIDEAEVLKLAALQCTLEEMATFFDCDISTIQKRFSKKIAKAREQGRISLRHKQMQKAMSGNVVMLIWLGKQWLGQREKADVAFEGGINIVMDSDLEKL